MAGLGTDNGNGIPWWIYPAATIAISAFVGFELLNLWGSAQRGEL
jgi:hypothetical protein